MPMIVDPMVIFQQDRCVEMDKFMGLVGLYFTFFVFLKLRLIHL